MPFQPEVSMVDEKIYWMGWQYLLPGSAKRIWNLVERFGSPGAAWMASGEALVTRGGFEPQAAASLVRRRSELDLQEELARLREQNITYITFEDKDYPQLLRVIFDPPPGLFVRGTLPPPGGQAVAVVGSRRPTPYGVAVAEKLGEELARAGVTVVSGMARGIDSAAHRGALAAGGRTMAVLGCGVDVVYPRENKRLMEDIIEAGAVISEFPPGSPPEAWHFPVRNRIISGLSRATVVVEAAEKSGALITADLALDQGRDVMAVPGPVTSPQSRGPNQLIKQGARLVESVADVLEELGITCLFPGKHLQSPVMPRLTAEEETVYGMLSGDPVPVDIIIENTGLAAQQVLSALMFLEVKGLVRQFPGRLYARREKPTRF
ncbi:DNA-processing protein DprA [Desulfofundulus kuznetsovii]